jgi:hypothetical protein
MERNMADETKLNQFMGKILGDLGGAFSVPMVHGRHRRSARRDYLVHYDVNHSRPASEARATAT